jgi:hypothetical protein
MLGQPAACPETQTRKVGIVTIIAAIAKALAPVGGGGSPVLIAAPAQAAALALRSPLAPWLVLPSTALADGEVVGIVPAGLATVVEPPRITAGAESTIHQDTAPTDIGTPGAPAVVAAPTFSMYQKDAVALRFILPAIWARRSPSAVAWVQTVTW